MRPNAVAIQNGHAQTTYGALVSAADQLAAQLIRAGARPDAPVAVCLERSARAIVAVLAALKAGGGYLPLDPDWPIERLRWILDDAGASIVVADPPLADQLVAPGRIALAEPAVGAAPVRRPSAPEPLSRAYVVYTSGSTGQPKGVEITHANLASLVDWHVDAFGLTARDHCAWIAALGFDASVWELFPALAVGATISIPPDDARRSPTALRCWLVEEGVTLAFVPTPLAEVMIRDAWPAHTRLRLLLTGGDVLHTRPRPDLPFEVVNNYGPTECTVVATSGPVAPGGGGLPTLGRPLPGSRVEIVGGDGQPVGPGEPGELWIAGPHVGRGYRNRPDLTEERFVCASLGGRPAQRYYRSGDLGRWTRDGEIAFLGRIDDQISRRGYRIEPNEISAVLDRHPSVAQSVVGLDGPGRDGRLVAYVTPAAGRIPRAGELRDFLSGLLPHYMLPEVFVRLDELPLTANDKVDRAALPTLAEANLLPSAPYRPPATPVEQRVAALVEALLDIGGVGLDDDFFLLGGHSLTGAQLVLHIRDLWGVDIALRDLFEAKSISNLAATVERAVRAMVAAMDEDEVAGQLTAVAS